MLTDLNTAIKFNGNQLVRQNGLIKSLNVLIDPTDISIDGWSNISIAKIPQDYVPSFNITNNYVDSGGKIFKLSVTIKYGNRYTAS